jgi:hypothetical protein
MANIGIVILLTLILVLAPIVIPRFVIWFQYGIKRVPDTILIQCPVCGEIHELRVIKILSCWNPKKCVVWCNKKHRGDILYNESKVQ